MKPATVEADYLEAPFEVARKYDDVRRCNRQGMNWLHRAAASHCYKLISNVLKNISKEGVLQLVDLVDKKDIDGQNPLFHACIKEVDNGRIQTIKVLLSNQTSFANLRSNSSGWTIAHWLAYHGDLESLAFLENAGLRCFLPDKKGLFAIDVAGRRGHSKVVAFLIKSFLNLRANTHAMPTLGQGYKPVDDYHPFFVASNYLYLVVTYWALFFNRPTKDLLPANAGGILESIGAIFSMAVSDRSIRDGKKDSKDTKKENEPLATETASIKGIFEGLLIEKVPPISLRLPTLGYQNLFHAAAAAETDGGLQTLFKLIPRYVQQELPTVKQMLDLPEGHPFDLSFMSDVSNELSKIAQMRHKTVVQSDTLNAAILGLDDWEAANEFGETPLHVATRNRRPANVKLLLGQGADFQAVNKNLWTPPNLAMDDFTLETYVTWFHKLRSDRLRGKNFYLTRSWVRTKGFVKEKGCCFKRKKVYVDNFKEKVEGAVDNLSANMLFNAEASTFYYFGMRIRINPGRPLEDKLQAAERADFVVDILAMRGYRVTLVTSSDLEGYLLLVHASNSKLNKVCIEKQIPRQLYGQHPNKTQVPASEFELQFDPFTHRVAQEVVSAELSSIFHMDELVKTGYFDDYVWLFNYGGIRKLEEAFFNWTFFGFNPFNQWLFLGQSSSLSQPKMVFFRHLFGFDAMLILAAQGFLICMLLITVIFFSFLQFTIYLAPWFFESASTALMICTLANLIIFFIGTHFFGRWAGQLPPSVYDQGQWKGKRPPIDSIILMVLLLAFLLIMYGGAWVLFEYLLQLWSSKGRFEDSFVKGLFAGTIFLLLKAGWENSVEAICEENLRESHRRTVSLISYFKIVGDVLFMLAYPVYQFWIKLYVLDMSTEETDSQFRYWIYGYAVIVFGLRPVLMVD